MTTAESGSFRTRWTGGSRLSLGLTLAILLVAVALTGRSGGRRGSGAVHGPSLAAYLPRSLDGRDAHDLPVAASAAVQQMVDSLLNYSDAVVRVYSVEGVDV